MPHPSPSPKPELLAPAGSWEAALAALEAGADSLYLGLGEWSARGRAKNFGLDDLRTLVPLAHGEGRRVYVALNTLLREDEMLGAAQAVWQLLCIGVNGLILQDLGLWAICRECFPEAPLHASTQLSVHNSAGALQLEAMGFSRVVLARECTVWDMAEIRRRSGLGLEVFVHGALCYSVSGLCLASSALLGRSANRGWCGQPCRWACRSPGGSKEQHPFSCSDLCLIDRVWDLARAGVSSLKIEGRLKAADYVHAVVRAYRKVLDAPEGDREGAAGAAREILRSVASRTATEGYAVHPRPREVLSEGSATAFGREVGKVLRWADGVATVAATVPLRRGDRIRIQGGDRGEGRAAVLRNLSAERAARGLRVTFPWPYAARRGDRVYRVKDARGEELEQRFAQKARAVAGGRGLPVRLSIRVSAGDLRYRARCGPAIAEGEVALRTDSAAEHPLDRGVLEHHLGRLGPLGYWLAGLEVEGELPPLVIPPSEFKAVRRAIAAGLDAAREAEGTRRMEAARALRRAPPPKAAPTRHLWASAEAPRSLRGLARLPLSRLVVPLNRECLKARDRLADALRGPEKVVWQLPPWLSERDVDRHREVLETLAREGYREVLAANLGHFSLVRGLPFRLHAGSELHALNGWAAAALRTLGGSSFTPSVESDRENLEALAAAGWPLRPVVQVYGDLPLFTTRLEPPQRIPEGGGVETADGKKLRWEAARAPLGEPWNRVYGPEPLAWTHHRAALQAMGVADFLLVFEGRHYPEGEIRAILKALEAGDRRAGTTEMLWAGAREKVS